MSISGDAPDGLRASLEWALPLAEKQVLSQPNVYPEALRRLREARAALGSAPPQEPTR